MDGLMILGLVALDFAFTLALAKGIKQLAKVAAHHR